MLRNSRAAVLGLAIAFLVGPTPTYASGSESTATTYGPPDGESGMPTMNLGDVREYELAFLSGQVRLKREMFDDYRTSEFCMFGFCFKCGIHGAHHKFNGVPRKHVQINTWRKGVVKV